MNIRRASVADVPQINDIFNWHSENGFATFAHSSSVEKRTDWFAQFDVSPKHVCFVAEENNRVVGLACSFAYRGGGVFENTVETSIYVSPELKSTGVGSKLYGALFGHLADQEVHRVVVGIALPNENSIAIHKKFGFTEIGVFDEYAYFKSQYRSSLWMQKKMN